MKLILTVGLPRSGKSTWARSAGFPIVCPDSIRLAIHGQRYLGPAEPWVWVFAYTMASALFRAGHETVIIDATNITSKRRAEWETRFPGYIDYKVIDTSPAVCISRAKAEGDEGIIPVIERMAADWDLPRPETWSHTPEAG